MSSVPDRSDIAEEYKWDLASLYADDEEWEAAFESVRERLDDLRAFEGRATDDPETLQATLETYEAIMRDVANVSTYARLRRDEDTADSHYQALASRAQSLSSEASSAASFLDPEIQELDRETVAKYVDENPDLEVYEHYFDDALRMKPHTRSAEVENLLAELGEVLGSTGEVYNMLTNADVEFPSVEDPDGEPQPITLNNFTTLQEDPNREFRRDVYETFYDEWEAYRNSIAAAYKNSVKTDVKLARARNYDTAREAALDGPNVPVEVYDTLVDTVDENLDVLQRHADLKRQSIGVRESSDSRGSQTESGPPDELKMWDLYVPMVDGESPDVAYDQAREWVTDRQQAVRSLLGRHLRLPAVHPDELPGRCGLDVHARPRGRPLAALGVHQRTPAVHLQLLRDIRGRGRQHRQRDAADTPPAGRRGGRDAPPTRPQPVPRAIPLDAVPPDHVRGVRARDPQA